MLSLSVALLTTVILLLLLILLLILLSLLLLLLALVLLRMLPNYFSSQVGYCFSSRWECFSGEEAE